jgi:hypothetical protein
MPKQWSKKEKVESCVMHKRLSNDKDMAQHKVKKLRLCMPHPEPSVFQDEDVTTYLEDFHTRFVYVPADKAANNIIVVCKHFYFDPIKVELGVTN